MMPMSSWPGKMVCGIAILGLGLGVFLVVYVILALAKM